jgi:uncharacterized protein YggE
MEPEIVVRGTGEVQVLPDMATLQIVVSADHATPDGAQARRGEVVEKVDAVLADHSDAISRTLPAAVGVQPRTRWQRGEAVHTGWRATRTTLVEVTGLDAIGRIMAGVAQAGAEVTGPRWSLVPDNPAHEAARRAAAADARRRAEAYAEALGLDLGPVAWVAEPGLRRPGPDGGYPVARGMMTLAAAGGPEGAVEEVTPAEVTIEAAVEVGFRIL